MNKLLGISLALVMLTGSIPLGFSEPLRVQLEQEIETKQIQCDNPNHVLVERNNGKLACLTEKTALKIGWKIIKINLDINKILDEFSVEWSDETLDDNPSEIVYEFPLIAKQPEITGIQNGEPLVTSWTQVDLQISNLPKLLESAKVTITVSSFDSTEDVDDNLRISFSPNFKVMSGLEDFTHIGYGEDGTSYYKKFVILEDGDDQIFDVTVVAFGAGEASISASTAGDDPISKSFFNLVIGKNETLLKDDYYKKYPAALATKLASIESAKLLAITEKEQLEKELLEAGCQYIEKVGMFCPPDAKEKLLEKQILEEGCQYIEKVRILCPTTEELEAMKNTDYETIGDTEEELRAYLKADGASDGEIEEIVREVYPKDSTVPVSKSTLSKISYDYPLSSKTFEAEYSKIRIESGITIESKNWEADFEVTISNLPKIGETALVTVTITNEMPFDLDEMFLNEIIAVQITDNFEFVDVPQDKIIIGDGMLYYSVSLDLDQGETATLSATVKAVKPGMGHVGGDASGYGFSYWMFVDESETLLKDDYYKLNPQPPVKPVEECVGPCEEPEPQFPAPLPEEENSTASSVPTTITEEELREDLKYEDLSEEEIEEIVRETIDPDSSTQFDEISNETITISGNTVAKNEKVPNSIGNLIGYGQINFPVQSVTFPSQVKVDEPFEVVLNYAFLTPTIDDDEFGVEFEVWEEPDLQCSKESCGEDQVGVNLAYNVELLDDRPLEEYVIEEYKDYFSPFPKGISSFLTLPFNNTAPQQETFRFVIHENQTDYNYGAFQVDYSNMGNLQIFFEILVDGTVNLSDKDFDPNPQILLNQMMRMNTERLQSLQPQINLSEEQPISEDIPKELWDDFAGWLRVVKTDNNITDYREWLLAQNMSNSFVNDFLDTYPELESQSFSFSQMI